MVNVTRGGIDLGGPMPSMPNFRGAGMRILRIAAVAVVLLLLLWSTTSIPTGNVGVLTLFGRVSGETLPEGIHLINPLKSVQKLSVQTQSLKESATVPSNEGLILALDTSLLFRLDKTKAAWVYQTIGEPYVEKVVEPTLRAAIRASTSAHTANALSVSRVRDSRRAAYMQERTGRWGKTKCNICPASRCSVSIHNAKRAGNGCAPTPPSRSATMVAAQTAAIFCAMFRRRSVRASACARVHWDPIVRRSAAANNTGIYVYSLRRNHSISFVE
jgi:hypothetical protein